MAELHVVALSGGKDSTAMALRLREIEPREYVYVCTPTGNELPEMWVHWRKLADLLETQLTPVIGGDLEGVIRQQRMIPNFRARFCTRMLKIDPYAGWLMRQAQGFDRIVSYVGIRADEPEREAGDYTDVPGVEMVFPMRTWGWSISTVRDYLKQRGVIIPKRTDCALCFWQRVGEWYDLYREHPEEWAKGEAIEAEIGHTFRSPGRDTWGVSMVAMRAEFEAGRLPRGLNKREQTCRVCRL